MESFHKELSRSVIQETKLKSPSCDFIDYCLTLLCFLACIIMETEGHFLPYYLLDQVRDEREMLLALRD